MEPYATELRSEAADEVELGNLDATILRAKDQLKKFCNGAQHIYDELGSWAADYYILASISNFKLLSIQKVMSYYLDGVTLRRASWLMLWPESWSE
jgi:hypothetical protein